METTYLEAPEPLPANEGEAVPEQTEAPAQSQDGQPEAAPEAPKEPEIEVEGQRLTPTQIKEALKALQNRDEWQKSNTRKAQELSEQRRKWELENQELLFIKKKMEEKPDTLQKILAPEPERNYEAELRELYNRKPEPFSQEYATWEYEKDKLNREIAKVEALRESQSALMRSTAMEHNTTVEKTAWDRYKDKVSWEEFRDLASWVTENIQARGGKYPQNSFDIAYQTLMPEKFLQEIKLVTAKEATKNLEKAKPSGDSGFNKPHDKMTPEEQSDDEFVQAIRARMRK